METLLSRQATEERAEAVRRTIHSFLHTDRLHRAAIERALADLGIHRSQHRLLMHLQRAEGRLSQKRLAEELDISPAAVAVTLRKLEQGGYLRRTADEGDARCKTIEITPLGKEVLRRGRSAFTEVDLLMFSDFSEEELSLFSSLLSRMRAALTGEAES
ncbi:MAG: MarR family transcriptional regulator [Clostridia bacterium]|nr:MarR family transcriptional regulator [Clostridia bacterium]